MALELEPVDSRADQADADPACPPARRDGRTGRASPRDRSRLLEGPRGIPPWRTGPARIMVVLPAYNEEKCLGPLLRLLDQAMYEDGVEYHVIVVNDGSKDATGRIAAEYAAHMPLRVETHEVNLGLGATIRDGLKVAVSLATDSDIIVAMDADNTHPPGLIHGMIQVIREGADVVIASRYRPGSSVHGVPFHRKVLSLGARFLFQIVFPISGVRDYTCGYRAYRARALKEAFQRYGDGFINQAGFQCMADILLKLRKIGLIFREVPLILRYDLKAGASKMNVSRTVLRTFRLMVERRFGA